MLLEHAPSTELLALERMQQARREARAARRGALVRPRPWRGAGLARHSIRGALHRAVVAVARRLRRDRTARTARRDARRGRQAHGRLPGPGARPGHGAHAYAHRPVPCPVCV